MQQSPRASVIIIVAVIAVGVGLAAAGSQHGWTLAGPGALAGFPGFALAVALAFVIQWVAWVPAALGQTDRFFDAVGSATYIAVTALLLVAAPALSARGVLVGVLVIVWAARLGSFLLARNIRSGGDDRFAEIRRNKLRFLSVWTVQALWVSLTAAAAWIAITSASTAPLRLSTWIGVALWLIGFACEVVADLQKSRFKRDPRNADRFISTGLWSVVRHPNYLGEIVLWVGVLVIALPVLEGWQWIALLSPVFVILLLTRVSGIPLLEAKAKRKWGTDPEYLAYRARTPALLPLPLGRRPEREG